MSEQRLLQKKDGTAMKDKTDAVGILILWAHTYINSIPHTLI